LPSIDPNANESVVCYLLLFLQALTAVRRTGISAEVEISTARLRVGMEAHARTAVAGALEAVALVKLGHSSARVGGERAGRVDGFSEQLHRPEVTAGYGTLRSL
jgi:hypothetical protein